MGRYGIGLLRHPSVRSQPRGFLGGFQTREHQEHSRPCAPYQEAVCVRGWVRLAGPHEGATDRTSWTEDLRDESHLSSMMLILKASYEIFGMSKASQDGNWKSDARSCHIRDPGSQDITGRPPRRRLRLGHKRMLNGSMGSARLLLQRQQHQPRL